MVGVDWRKLANAVILMFNAYRFAITNAMSKWALDVDDVSYRGVVWGSKL